MIRTHDEVFTAVADIYKGIMDSYRRQMRAHEMRQEHDLELYHLLEVRRYLAEAIAGVSERIRTLQKELGGVTHATQDGQPEGLGRVDGLGDAEGEAAGEPRT